MAEKQILYEAGFIWSNESDNERYMLIPVDLDALKRSNIIKLNFHCVDENETSASSSEIYYIHYMNLLPFSLNFQCHSNADRPMHNNSQLMISCNLTEPDTNADLARSCFMKSAKLEMRHQATKPSEFIPSACFHHIKKRKSTRLLRNIFFTCPLCCLYVTSLQI